MSGVEVAGLLLGSFPLLISALEHYRETAEVLEDWWQMKAEYKKCKNEIKVQELAFENNLEHFLLPLVVSDDEIQSLLAEPGGKRWKDPTLGDRLQSRLPKSYDVFLDTIYDIQVTMDGLRDELGLDRLAFQKALEPAIEHAKKKKSVSPLRSIINRSKKGSQKSTEKSESAAERSWKKWLGRPNFEYQTQRIKFSLGRTNRTKLFEELSRYNRRLRELLDTCDRSTALMQRRDQTKKPSFTKAFCKFWRHAAALHKAIEQAWCCQCKHMHSMHILLRHEMKPEISEYCIFFLNTINQPFTLPWTSLEVTARRIEYTTLVVSQHGSQESHRSESLPPLKASQSRSTSSIMNPRSALRTSTNSQLPSRQKVTWKDPSTSPAATLTGQQPSTINNICSSIALCCLNNTDLGVLQSDEESYLLQPKSESQNNLHQSISLDTLLQGQPQHVKLNRRQRYTIAFLLVSSHLQLYPSPWLTSHWAKKNIIFARDTNNPSFVNYDQPYMRRDASPMPQTESSYAASDRLLSTLGILLIELCFGVALENHEMRRQCQGDDQANTNADLQAALDLGVALEWSRSVAGEAGERYADAVQWCLKGQPTGVKDDKWREQLFTNVFLPLQFCYEQFQPQAQ